MSTRLMLEKPLGTDTVSARSLNGILTRLVPQDQVHRIDHFLRKSKVVNILGLRFANRIFEPVLTRRTWPAWTSSSTKPWAFESGRGGSVEVYAVSSSGSLTLLQTVTDGLPVFANGIGIEGIAAS